MTENQQNRKMCPICGEENDLSSQYCHTCGWEFKEFPSTNSPYFLQEKKREEISKSHIERLLSDIEGKKKYIAKIQGDLEKSRKTVTEKQNELETTQKNLKRASKRIEELEANNKNLNDSKDKISKKLTETANLLEATRKELEIAQKELKELRNRPQPIPTDTTYPTTLKGVVCVKNISSEALCYLPIYDGVHTYGNAPDSNGHHQIKLRIRGAVIPEKLFSIQFRNDRITVQDLSKGQLTSNGVQIPVNGVYVDANTKLFFQDILEIHISKI